MTRLPQPVHPPPRRPALHAASSHVVRRRARITPCPMLVNDAATGHLDGNNGAISSFDVAAPSHYRCSMTRTESLRNVMARGVELQAAEAVAITRQLIASLSNDAEVPAPLGRVSLDTVRLAEDGSVVCEPGTAQPSPAEIATLLAEMLPPEGTARVPGALRYTIARALSHVDAPGFDSVADLSAALARHEPHDPPATVRGVHARLVPTVPTQAPEVDRRRPRVSASVLRHQLRQADEELFLHLNRPGLIEAATESAPLTPTSAGRLRDSRSPAITGADRRVSTSSWALAGALAISLSFAAGYSAVTSVRAAHAASSAATTPATESTPAPDDGRGRAIASASRSAAAEKREPQSVRVGRATGK
jgi:hypothetical protein